MIKTKLAFGALILFFAALILFSLTFYKGNNIIENSLATGYTFLETTSANLLSDEPPVIEKPITVYNNTSDSSDSNPGSCVFTPPSKKTVILRLDDVGAWHYHTATVNLTNDIIDRNMAISFGVIPENLTRDQPFIDYMNSIRDNPQIELTQHGNHHIPSEFLNLTYDEALIAIQEGRNEMINNLKVAPITFVPPSNDYNEETIRALTDSGFQVISARDSEYKTDGKMNFIGGDIETFDFQNGNFVAVDEVIESCKTALAMKNVCVVTMHPQDYTFDNDPGTIDPAKYAEYKRMLEELGMLDVEFKTFRDLVHCA